MRTLIALSLALLLTGCPDSTPATSQLEDAPTAESDIAHGEHINPHAPTLEVTDIPSSNSEPRLDDEAGIRHAAAFEGDVALEGSGVTGGGRESNPFLVSIPASAGDLVQVHLRGTFEGDGTGALSAQVSVPGYSTIISVPATDAWIYKAFYMPSSGMLEIRLFNGATYNGPLNVDAASISYYAKSVPTPFADEPNADNDATTLTDRTMASTIALATPTTRGLIQVAAGPLDTEEWYSLSKGNNDPELKVTFDAYSHRYGTWQYEITFYNSTGVQIGLKTIFKAPAAAKVFSLSRLPVASKIYMRVLAKPLSDALTTNAAYALHNLATEAPLAIRPIADKLLPPLSQMTFSATAGGIPSAAAVWNWDFGGGAGCNFNCEKASPNITTGEPGWYTGTVWVQDGSRISTTQTFSYRLTCNRWPNYASSWTPGVDHPGVVWDAPVLEAPGILVSSGGKPYAIMVDTGADVRSMDLWHSLGGANQQYPLQLAATPHAGRLYIACLDYYTKDLIMWVSSDAVPNQKADWKLITLDERTVTDRPIQIASSGNRLAVLYATGAGGSELRLAYSKTQLADRQLDWGTGVVQREFIPTAQTLTAHANRWWIAQRESGPGRVTIAASRDLAPFSDTHWNSHPLVATSATGSQSNISLTSAGGYLTAIYATPVSTWYDFRLARATVAVPQISSDWTTGSIIPAVPAGYPFYETPDLPIHAVTILEGGYMVAFETAANSIALWRSCDFEPKSETDWSRGLIPNVSSLIVHPDLMRGVAAPGDGFAYALYIDETSTRDYFKLHQLRLDFW